MGEEANLFALHLQWLNDRDGLDLSPLHSAVEELGEDCELVIDRLGVEIFRLLYTLVAFYLMRCNLVQRHLTEERNEVQSQDGFLSLLFGALVIRRDVGLEPLSRKVLAMAIMMD